MSNRLQAFSTRVAGTSAKRRALLQAGAGAGVLLAAGVPSFVLADQDPPDANHFKNLDVTGPATGNVTGTFRGKLTMKGFYAQGTQVFGLGFVRGSVFDAAGNELQKVQGAVSGPVAFQPAAAAAGSSAPAAGIQQATTTSTSTTAASCSILTLVLGPLHLDLLGLVIDIPLPIILTITAVPGPGNLLGNLLCAVANLLNGTPLNLSAIINDLNNLLAGLGL